MPLVSVILPLYNAENWIGEAVKSIICQTFEDFELIIINDGSTDGSLAAVEKIKDKRMVIVDQENCGLAAALNVGLKISKGQLVARMDADDTALPDRLLLQVNSFKQNEDLVLLGTGVNYVDESGKYICRSYPLMGDGPIKKFLLKKGNVMAHPTVMFRRNAVLEVGGYSEIIGQYFEDHYLWCSIMGKGKFENIAKPLLNYRMTESSISSMSGDIDDFNKKIFKYIEVTATRGVAELGFLCERRERARTLSKQERAQMLHERIVMLKKSEDKHRKILRCLFCLNEEIALRLLSATRAVLA